MATKPLPVAKTKEQFETIYLIVGFLYWRLPTGPISKQDKQQKDMEQILYHFQICH